MTYHQFNLITISRLLLADSRLLSALRRATRGMSRWRTRGTAGYYTVRRGATLP